MPPPPKKNDRARKPEISHRLPLSFDVTGSTDFSFPVPKSILDEIFPSKNENGIRDIELIFNYNINPTNTNNSLATDYELLYPASANPCVAKIRTEEIFFINQAKKIKFLSVSVTSIEKIKGSPDSKATHILAVCVGAVISKRIMRHIESLEEDFILTVNLLLDVNKTVNSVEAYWEFESAVEKYTEPYTRRNAASKKLQITSSM